MREIACSTITNAVKEACIDANIFLHEDVIQHLRTACNKEDNPIAKDMLSTLVLNAELAQKKQMPSCQDTGIAIVFVELGQEVHITHGLLEEAINEGVRQGYKEGYLRMSIVDDPILHRKNTKDNTPAIIWYTLCQGDGLKITLLPKGGGAENMSMLTMLKPANTMQDVLQIVVEHVKHISGNPCPPIIIGLGIGGSFDRVAYLAKKALLRPLSQKNNNPEYAEWEEKILTAVNETGVGPQGIGGKTTALAVLIEEAPCHFASLPVAINIECHAHRSKIIQL